MQANVNGNVDVVISNGAYATFRGWLLPRSVHRHRHSADDELHLSDAPHRRTAQRCTVPANLQGPQLTQNTPRAQITDFDTTKRTLFNADYNHTFQSAGWHTLKGGFGYQHTMNDVNSLYPGGYVDIFWDRTLRSWRARRPIAGTYGYYDVNDRGTFGKAGANILSLYVQDQWQIGDRLTLNLGVRTENENVPAFRPEIQENAFEFGFGEKIAPRLGFSVRRDG